jgi:hypothetical protein
MKVKTARGAVNALPIPNAIAPNRNREGNETDGLLARERARGSERAGELKSGSSAGKLAVDCHH